MPYCPSCGTQTDEADSFCTDCGADLSGRSASDGGSTTADAYSNAPESTRTTTDVRSDEDSSKRDTHYYIGVVAAVACVLLFPYFLVFVAIPESIMQYWGKSIQDSLGENARDNPFMSGSFLIIRWFGNFLLFLVVIGLFLGLVLIAL